MNISPTSAMLRRVSRRLHLAAFGRRIYAVWLAACGAYTVLLLVSRLSGAIPDVFTLRTLLTIPLSAIPVAWLLHRRPSEIDAARAVDHRCRTNDLYLTTVLLDRAPGEFKPLVVRSAESKSVHVKPVEVVPFSWRKRAGYGFLMLCLLIAAVRFLPQFDPFGKVEAAEKVVELQKKLHDSQDSTKERLAQVLRDAEENEQSSDVDKAIDDLKKAFNGMQPQAKTENFKTLSQLQKQLGEKWTKLNGQKLKDLLSQTSPAQQFGDTNQEQLQKWTRELQEGSTASAVKEIEKLQAEIQALKKISDPVEREREMQRLRKRLQDLADFASENVKSKPLAAAVQRALEQMAIAKSSTLSDQALNSASDSLELSKLELQEIAKSLQELEKLEQSLKALQMAKSVNDAGQLDGEACEGCKSIADYEALYAKLMAGQGLEGEGQGAGGEAPEDDSIETGFKSEHAKSAVTAGKVLLTLKTKGQGDPAEIEKNHRELIHQVKQGVSEAVLQEQVPPGYHDGIKKYFDSLDSAPAEPSAEEK